jgi:hypothetical protein
VDLDDVALAGLVAVADDEVLEFELIRRRAFGDLNLWFVHALDASCPTVQGLPDDLDLDGLDGVERDHRLRNGGRHVRHERAPARRRDQVDQQLRRHDHPGAVGPQRRPGTHWGL